MCMYTLSRIKNGFFRDTGKCLFLIAFLVFSNASVYAAPEQDFNITLGGVYDSNSLVRLGDDSSFQRGTIAPDYQLSWLSDRYELIARARINFQRSSEPELYLDREDPLLDLQWAKLSPRGRFSIAGGYDEISALFSEYEDTRLIRSDATEKKSRLNTGWTHSLSERVQFDFNAGYLGVKFDAGTDTDTGGTGYNDYNTVATGLGFTYLVDEGSSRYIRLGTSQYEPENPGTDLLLQDESNLYSLTVGSTWKLSDLLGVDTNISFVEVAELEDSSNINWVAALNYKGGRLSAILNFSRAIQAGSAGGYRESDNVSTQLAYQWSPSVDIGFSVSWRKNAAAFLEEIGNEVRKAEISLDKELSEQWSLITSWQFVQLKDVFESDAHIFSLSVRYTLPD